MLPLDALKAVDILRALIDNPNGSDESHSMKIKVIDDSCSKIPRRTEVHLKQSKGSFQLAQTRDRTNPHFHA